MAENNTPQRKEQPRGFAGGARGGPGVMPQGEKANNFKGAMRDLFKYMRAYIPQIIFTIICAIAACVFSIVGPSILGQATTVLYEGVMNMVTGTGGIDFAAIQRILLFLLIIYVISALLNYVQGFLMAGVATKISYNMRRDLSEKINRMPLSYFDRMPQGEVLSRITNDVDTVSQTLNQSLSQMIIAITTVIGVIVMMLSISPVMTLIAFCVLPISFFVLSLIIKRSQPLFKVQQEQIGKVNGHVEEMYGAHVVVKAFNGEADSMEKFSKINAELYHSAWKSQYFSGMMMPVMNFVGNLGYVGVCILGGFLVLRGSISVGDIQAFIQYTRSFTQPLQQIANVSNIMQQTAAAAERVFEFLNEDEEAPNVENTVSPEKITGDVEFKNVSFGYVPEKTIINNFSSYIESGKRVAIVGPTGAGKTTIVKLLMRFYDVNSGSVMLSGNDIKQFNREDLRESFGMVLQDTWLYNGTIMENIRYGRLEASDEEVIEAAKAAQVHHFVRTMPEGYNTVINEEASNISQGQRQLLTIARTIISNPKILIFDEATSSVDTRTELAIQKAMNELMNGRTSFIIAHRLSTIRDADTILVMKDGDVIETGSHDALIAKGGFYKDLYESQFAKPDLDEAN